jgi:putative DNA primase/helicase
LISSLARWGMNIKCTPVARRLFAEYLGSVDVEERVTIVHRNGWVEIGGARAFALPNDIIAGAGKERLILAKDAIGPYAQTGTLESWKSSVGILAQDHRFLRFSIATALAGTLLYIGGFESGCFHLYEKSSEGKTTSLRMAASVWGSGADGGYIRTWRSTANGLEGALAGANDTCLVLDEVGQADGRELGRALYMATGGVGKQRMRRDATLKPSHVWRALVLSGGEHPIQTKLSEDLKRGTRAYAGHLVRAIDIRARRTHGVFDAFEADDIDPKAFADQCKSAASTHYGTAGPEFVRQLIARNISATDVRERVEAFVQDALVEDYHGQAARVAERFGLISAAGEYGVQFGILPCTRSTTQGSSSMLGSTAAAARRPMKRGKQSPRFVISSKRTAIAVLKNWFRSKMRREGLSLICVIPTRARRSIGPVIASARVSRSDGSFSRKSGRKKFARGSTHLRWPQP